MISSIGATALYYRRMLLRRVVRRVGVLQVKDGTGHIKSRNYKSNADTLKC
jgi:hypothetical protein